MMSTTPPPTDPQRLHELGELVADVNEAARSLPERDRLMHDAAQASVSDARYHAEIREGELRVH